MSKPRPVAHDVARPGGRARAPATQRPIQARRRQRVLAANVQVATLAAGGVSGDGHRLDHGERVLLHEDAVLEGAGLRLVGVAHEVVRADRGPGHGVPLAAGGKGRAAAAHELRVDDLADDALRSELEGAAQRRVAAVGPVVVEAVRVDVADAAQQPEPGHPRLRAARGPIRRVERL